jgi:hypothetical protein
LDEFVNTPPFKRICPEKDCEDVVGCIKFPCDSIAIKNRERVWSQNQARQCELEDLDSYMGFEL